MARSVYSQCYEVLAPVLGPSHFEPMELLLRSPLQLLSPWLFYIHTLSQAGRLLQALRRQ